jgi:dolichol-phosphate mannosyltransferase
MFHVIGVVALAAFVALSGFAICCKLFTDGAIPGWTCYLLAASFFGAINALAIGILGEYAVRIYDQVRGRPAYLVDRTVNFSASPPEDAGDAPYAELLQEATEMLRVGNAGRREERPGAEQDEADWQMAFTCDDE